MLEHLDQTIDFVRTGYPWIQQQCDKRGTDIFETRLMLQRTICMKGRAAAEVFYDGERFERAGAAPRRVLATLLGKKGVQGLDGPMHHQRKELFMRWLDPVRVDDLVRRLRYEWRRVAAQWPGDGRLLEVSQEVLTRAVCAWTGVPLAEEEVAQRARDFNAMIEGAGAIGPAHWHSRWARHRTERWISRLLADVRPLSQAATTPLEAFSTLPPDAGAVDLINILRPVVAVSRYIVFAALALHQYPAQAPRNDRERLAFVQEVRRLYPFFPAAMARVKKTFRWHGVLFERGTRTLLDLYGSNHDAAVWDRPDTFDRTRFDNRAVDAFTLIPQGGGDTLRGHRCAGEQLSIAVISDALEFFQTELTYRVPPQDVSIDVRRMPTNPASGFVMSDVSLRSAVRIAPNQGEVLPFARP